MTAVRPLIRPVLTVLIALSFAGLVILATGGNPLAAYRALFEGAFGGTHAIFRTLAKATPLLLTGLAVSLALRAGMFNIGAEGQLIIGGLAAAWAGFAIQGLPLMLHLPLAILAGAVGGGLWSFLPGLLKAWRGTHEVIVTIMMNYIAFEVTHYLVNNPLRDVSSGATATPKVRASAMLVSVSDVNPLYSGTNLSAGLILALAAALGFAYLFRKTALGFEIRAVGLGPDAARANGIPVGRTMITAMIFSGMLAGTAGAVEVLGVHRRFLDAFSPGYGFDSIAVALLGGMSAGGVTLSAVLFGALNSGALNMELSPYVDPPIPRQISGIVQAAVILAVASRYVRKRKPA